MAPTYSTVEGLGSLAADFELKGVDDRIYSLEDFRESPVLVVTFMCNHCPYVIAIQKRMNALAKEFTRRGVAWIGINSNDSTRYPADGFDEMKKRAQEEGFAFPYLWDPTQEVARAYGAVCTPEFYVYVNQEIERSQRNFVLKYRGRLDDNWKDETAVTRQELRMALEDILEGKDPSSEQVPAMGCSIKWK